VLDREAPVWAPCVLEENLVTVQMPPLHRITFPLKLFLIPHSLSECSLEGTRKTLFESVTEVLQAAHLSRLGSIADMRISMSSTNSFMNLRAARQ
jgi:hypothetical protein